MIKYKILILSLLYSITLYSQSVKDTIVSPVVKKQSKYKFNTDRYYIGIDAIKPFASALDKMNNAISFFIESPVKNKVWATLNIGTQVSSFENSKLSFRSNSQSMSIQVSQIFFPPNYLKDDDNVFAGVGYGLSRSQVGNARYWIVDQWGNYNGQLPGYSRLFHWIEVNAGFRFMVVKGWTAGWRIEGKNAINPGVFRNKVAPEQIALFGRGDKSTAFQYQLCIAKRLKRKVY